MSMLKRFSRRRFLILGTVSSIAAMGIFRMTSRDGAARALTRLTEIVISPKPSPSVSLDVVKRVDAYVNGLPRSLQKEILGAIYLLNQGTIFRGKWKRFSSLGDEDATQYFDWMSRAGGLRADAANALRELCLLGYYQRPESWGSLGYEGPRISSTELAASWPEYDALRASPNARPKGGE